MVIGEAVVDLVAKADRSGVGESRVYRPYLGGTGVNVSIAAMACGVPVTLASGAGDDRWGRWLRMELDQMGLDMGLFVLVSEHSTAISLIDINDDGEPTFSMYGECIGSVLTSLAPRLPDAVEAAGAVFFTSNTLVGEQERSVTSAIVAQASAGGRPTLFDPNIRLNRWPSRDAARHACLSAIRGVTIATCNLEDALLITGEGDAESAAGALLDEGPTSVIVTLGSQGAIIRGSANATVPAVQAQVISTVGAGDALSGVILGHLAKGHWDPPDLVSALREGVSRAAEATERWGAVR
ncbi:MAG: carbohydrate kinase family protein [Solirubrobacteraceae bacterium]